MKTSSVSSGHQMLPLGNTSFLSYQAGDDRVNQQPLLTVIHTIWLREHNRIAENMVRAVPGQTDEFYYQHARRLVIAEMQHIIYNEYLPVMIGPELAAQIMSPKYDYLDRGNPAVFNEFSTAAFRVGHSQLRSLVGIMEKDVHKVDRRLKFDLREPPNLSYLPPAVSANFTDQALHGLLGMLVQTGTPSQAYELIRTQHFQPKETAAPFDLISLNVQRGRDHGLPPYTKMLNYFDRNNVPSNFEELLPFIPEETVSAMRSVYESVDDIDLFVAGLIEKPLPDAMLGRTFSRIFAAQFLNLKRTDRFFYNYVDQSTGFRSNQLAEIQNVSLARIICDNSDGTITRIQPKVFRTPEEFNRLVSCDNFSELPGINFSKMLPL